MQKRTREETRDDFLDTVRATAKYWSKHKGATPEQIANGVAFGIMSILDGVSCSFPVPLTLVVDTGGEDDIDSEYVDGMEINGCEYLHDIYYTDEMKEEIKNNAETT